jgi:asparagine synthase (glutamine-hydrolysing)
LPLRWTLGRRAQKYLVNAGLSPEDRLLSYFLWVSGDVLRDLYSADLGRLLADHDPLEPLRGTLARIPAEPDRLNRMLYLEARHFLPDHNLNYTDKMSMAHGVEVRVPLLDRELIAYAAHLPPGDKVRRLHPKAMFKDAMRPYLPPPVLSRHKTGFGAPLRRWIREDLRDMVRDVLSEKRLAHRGLFDPAAVQRLIEDNERFQVDGAYLIFGLMCIEMWLRAFVDAPPAVPARSAG